MHCEMMLAFSNVSVLTRSFRIMLENTSVDGVCRKRKSKALCPDTL